MARIENWFEQDLKKSVPVRKLEGVFNEDSQANVIGVQLYDDGVALTSISGSVTGYFLLADGTTTSISGSKSGGKASVAIPPAAYKVTGPITITIRIVNGSDITTVCACVGLVMLTKTPVATPAGSTVADWSAQISAQLAACQAAADAVGATVAVPFNEAVANDAGTYITSSGHMYYLPNGHTANVSLANTTKVETNCGTELTTLKSAISEYPNRILHITPFVVNSYVKRNGEIATYGNWSRTEYIDIGYCSKLIAITSNGGDYNCFYNANKEFISYFAVGTTDTEVSVPTDAKYVMFSNTNQGMADLSVTFVSKEQKSNTDSFAEIDTEIDELKNVTGMFSKTVDQLDDASNALSRSSRWVIGFYKKGTVVGDLRLAILANNLSVVKAQIWSTDNGTTYYPVKTVDPISCNARTGDQFFDLYFPSFTLQKDSFLTFTDSSSGNYGRYATAEGKNLLYFSGSSESITVADMSTLSDAELSYYITTYYYSDTNNIVTVKSDGTGTYRTVIDAVANEPEGTPIYIYPGTYKGTVQAFEKRIILIGVDRNTCILQSTSGLYANPAINASCGYLENLTIRSDYINGESSEIGSDQSGAYAIHCENEYGVGKTLEIHHCTLYSDFFPAIGCGLRKDFHLILDDCELINNQVSGRGNYTADGSLGALYFHDTIGEKGAQHITVKNCVLRSSLGNTMTIYRVYPASAGDHVTCDFIENVLKDAVNGYSNNIWERDSNPFGSGAFSIGIGFGNSNSYLNNNT